MGRCSRGGSQGSCRAPRLFHPFSDPLALTNSWKLGPEGASHRVLLTPLHLQSILERELLRRQKRRITERIVSGRADISGAGALPGSVSGSAALLRALCRGRESAPEPDVRGLRVAQRAVRQWIANRHRERADDAAAHLQALCRGYRVRKEYAKAKKARLIQRQVRLWLQQRSKPSGSDSEGEDSGSDSEAEGGGLVLAEDLAMQKEFVLRIQRNVRKWMQRTAKGQDKPLSFEFSQVWGRWGVAHVMECASSSRESSAWRWGGGLDVPNGPDGDSWF